MSEARADVLDVPAEHATIQAAIAAAQPGDSVRVAPGTYVETIDFLGKALTVESSGGPLVTIVDGNGAGSVVSFVSGEPAGTTLRGFAIQGGSGSDFTASSLRWSVGGGVKIVDSHATLEDCFIGGNQAADQGGGIFVYGHTGQASLTLRASLVTSNAVTAWKTARGGGLFAHGAQVVLEEVYFWLNLSSGSGGGFAVESTDAAPGGLVATGVELDTNIASLDGGGGWADLAGPATLAFTDCLFFVNSAARGGGLAAWVTAVDPDTAAIELERCRFDQNTAGSGGGVFATMAGAGRLALADCIVDHNADTGIEASGLVDLTNCTVAHNLGVGLRLLSHEGRITNSIVWHNEGPAISSNPPSRGVSWCDIEGGHPGVGNLDVAPHFVWPSGFGDYRLAADSVCLQAGDPDFDPPVDAVDFDGDPRVLFGRVDIGAHEATVPDGPWTHLGHALAGPPDGAQLTGAGPLEAATTTTLTLANATPGRPSWLVFGAAQLQQPFKSGVMVPTIDVLVGPIGTGPIGAFSLSGPWPSGIPSGFTIAVQCWIVDPTGPAGFTASNALSAEAQ